MSQLNVNTIKNRVGNSGPTIDGNTTVSGILTATSFSGDGSSLTNLTLTGNGNLSNLTVSGLSTFTGAADFTGNVTIGGTLTYRDVTNIDSVGMVTARKGIQVLADGLTVTGITTVGTALSLADNVKAKFGTGGDLEIYHSSTASHITDVGTGNFIIGSNGGSLKITKGADTENMAVFTPDGAAELYYNNVKKLETTTGGVVITGITTSTIFDGDLTGNVTGTAATFTGTVDVGGLDGVIYSGVSTTATSKTVVNREFCEVTAAAQTITLPASPTAGHEVYVAIGNFTDTVVARNGSNIMSLAEDMTLDVAYKNVKFVYVNSTIGWRIN